jgi:hypothetical protein
MAKELFQYDAALLDKFERYRLRRASILTFLITLSFGLIFIQLQAASYSMIVLFVSVLLISGSIERYVQRLEYETERLRNTQILVDGVTLQQQNYEGKPIATVHLNEPYQIQPELTRGGHTLYKVYQDDSPDIYFTTYISNIDRLLNEYLQEAAS